MCFSCIFLSVFLKTAWFRLCVRCEAADRMFWTNRHTSITWCSNSFQLCRCCFWFVAICSFSLGSDYDFPKKNSVCASKNHTKDQFKFFPRNTGASEQIFKTAELTFFGEQLFSFNKSNATSAATSKASLTPWFTNELDVSANAVAVMYWLALIACSDVIGNLWAWAKYDITSMSLRESARQPHNTTGVVEQCERISGYHWKSRNH